MYYKGKRIEVKQLVKEGILRELNYRTSRSSGAGGQHVNKVETRVEALFVIEESQYLTEEEKERIEEKLTNRINKEGELQVACEEGRSQANNKAKATEMLIELLEKALVKPKKRKKSKPSKAAVKKRLDNKKKQAEKKTRRKNDRPDI